MKIECIIRRKGGSFVNLDGKPGPKGRVIGGTTYHFTPGQDKDGKDLDGPHLADVRNEKHIARLLAITSAYRIYDPEGKIVDQAPRQQEPPPETVSPPAAPTNTGEGQQGGPADPGTAPPAGEAVNESVFARLSDDELRAKVEEKTGRKPHPNAKRETLLRLLEAPAGAAQE